MCRPRVRIFANTSRVWPAVAKMHLVRRACPSFACGQVDGRTGNRAEKVFEEGECRNRLRTEVRPKSNFWRRKCVGFVEEEAASRTVIAGGEYIFERRLGTRKNEEAVKDFIGPALSWSERTPFAVNVTSSSSTVLPRDCFPHRQHLPLNAAILLKEAEVARRKVAKGAQPRFAGTASNFASVTPGGSTSAKYRFP